MPDSFQKQPLHQPSHLPSFPRCWIKASLLCVWGLGILVSCRSLPDGTPIGEIRAFTVPPESIQAISEIRLRWMIREDAGEYCREQLKRPAASATSPLPLACALWNTQTKECTVVTKPTTTHVIMGHEVHHCFAGHFHKM